MRAAQITELRAPPRLAEVEGSGSVAVEAVALNPLDVAVAGGVFYGGHPPLPYVPGCEAAGRREDGSPVYLFGDGRGTVKQGFMAERVDVPVDLPLRLPDGVDPVVAAAAGIAGVAAWVPVAWRARVTPADRVLVLGATGPVGRVAVQAATLLGAEKVVGVGRADLGRVAEEFGGDGFTVCIDPVWGDPLAGALPYAARRARIVHLGQSAGPESPLRSADVRGKELTIMGHSNFALSKHERDRAYLELLEHVVAGRIELAVERYDLDHVSEAWARQVEGPHAKIVVTL